MAVTGMVDRDKQEWAELKGQAVNLALRGWSCKSIGEKLGVRPGLVWKWLDKTGIDTSPSSTGGLECPNCDGTLERQPLWFWRCECGAELWPAEDQVPEPEEWSRPWRLTHQGADETWSLVAEWLDQAWRHKDIVEELNRRGHTTPRGKPWTLKNFQEAVRRYGISRTEEQRQEVLDIVADMAGNQDVTFGCIARRLNDLGYRTAWNTPYSERSVGHIARNVLNMDFEARKNLGLSVPQDKGARNPWGTHPWRERTRRGQDK